MDGQEQSAIVTETPKPMTGTEVMDIILGLARSQGFYSRLWLGMDEMRREDPEGYAAVLDEWEKEKFTDVLQVVLYFEEGKHNARTFWEVPVLYEVRGHLEVEAATAAEARQKVAAHPEDYGLPEDGCYEVGSLRVVY